MHHKFKCLKQRVINGYSTDAVHQLGEGTVGVPAAPLLVQLWQWREEVLEGAYAPCSRSDTAIAAVLGRSGISG